MDTIFKYTIPGEPGTIIAVETLDGPVVHVGLDPQGLACLWVRGDTDSERKLRSMILVGTGWDLKEHGVGSMFWKHLGSFVQGPFVWHLWEV